MIFDTTHHGIRKNVILAAILSIIAIIIFTLIGCTKNQDVIPAKYNVRETENGVYIFEYDPGNQYKNGGDNLTLFTDTFNSWMRDHPEFVIKRFERIVTTVNSRNTDGNPHKVTVINIIIYTGESGKPPLSKSTKMEDDK